MNYVCILAMTPCPTVLVTIRICQAYVCYYQVTCSRGDMTVRHLAQSTRQACSVSRLMKAVLNNRQRRLQLRRQQVCCCRLRMMRLQGQADMLDCTFRWELLLHTVRHFILCAVMDVVLTRSLIQVWRLHRSVVCILYILGSACGHKRQLAKPRSRHTVPQQPWT